MQLDESDKYDEDDNGSNSAFVVESFFQDKIRQNQENKNPSCVQLDSGSSSAEKRASSGKIATEFIQVEAEKLPRPSRLNHLDILSRLFPQQKHHVLDLVLRSCNNDLKKTIEHFISLNDAILIQNQCLKPTGIKKTDSGDQFGFNKKTCSAQLRSPSPKRVSFNQNPTGSQCTPPFTQNPIFTASHYAAGPSLVQANPPTIPLASTPPNIYNMFPHLLDLNAMALTRNQLLAHSKRHEDPYFSNTNFLNTQYSQMNALAVAMAAANSQANVSHFLNTNGVMHKQQQIKSRALSSCSPSSFSNSSSITSPLNATLNSN